MNYITPIFTTDGIEEVKSYPLSFVKENMEKLESMMATMSLSDNLTASLGSARLDGIMVSQYEAKIVSRFYVGEDLIVSLADGFFLNVSEMVRLTIEIHES